MTSCHGRSCSLRMLSPNLLLVVVRVAHTDRFQDRQQALDVDVTDGGVFER